MKILTFSSLYPNGAQPAHGVFVENRLRHLCAHAPIEARVKDSTMPRWEQADGRVKLSAAWLIERAGFKRGHHRGKIGLSTRHALAIVAHEGARAADLIAFAAHLRATVEERFGVRLTLEPVVWDHPSL